MHVFLKVLCSILDRTLRNTRPSLLQSTFIPPIILCVSPLWHYTQTVRWRRQQWLINCLVIGTIRPPSGVRTHLVSPGSFGKAIFKHCNFWLSKFKTEPTTIFSFLNIYVSTAISDIVNNRNVKLHIVYIQSQEKVVLCFQRSLSNLEWYGIEFGDKSWIFSGWNQ